MWAAPAAAASEPTCQGQPATIVGEPGGSVRGTDGPDVVVSDGARWVVTGAGDDVVCLTGSSDDGHRVRFASGAGHDSVVVTSTEAVTGHLGHGEDTFVGGDERDLVRGGELESVEIGGDTGEQYVDRDRDTISTGGGDDGVAASNDDTVSLGRGDDGMNREVLAGAPYAGDVDGGPGRNFLGLNVSGDAGKDAGSWVLDTHAGTFSRNGETHLSLTDFTGFQVRFAKADEELRVRGSRRHESFEAYGLDGLVETTLSISAGGGNDEIYVGRAGYDLDDVLVRSIDGGPGRDRLVVSQYEGPSVFRLDLAAGAYRHGNRGTTTKVPVAGIEHAQVTGIPFLTMRGSSSGNRLAVTLPTGWQAFERCRVLLSGRGGDDLLRVLEGPRSRSTSCPGPVLRGERGSDLLVGSQGDDTLVGGPGRDVARGGPGRDVCRAEVRMGCERR